MRYQRKIDISAECLWKSYALLVEGKCFFFCRHVGNKDAVFRRSIPGTGRAEDVSKMGEWGRVCFISCRGGLLETQCSHLPQAHTYSHTEQSYIYITHRRRHGRARNGEEKTEMSHLSPHHPTHLLPISQRLNILLSKGQQIIDKGVNQEIEAISVIPIFPFLVCIRIAELGLKQSSSLTVRQGREWNGVHTHPVTAATF
jgi:hypothetical protein